MLQIVNAIEQDGLDIRTLTMVFEVPDGKFDLVEAVKAAATDYCLTPEGRGTYDYNCHSFNWADFDSVPNKFMEKYGFRKVEDGFLADIVVNWDEELVDDGKLPDDEEDNGIIGLEDNDNSDDLDEEDPRADESPRTVLVREKNPIKVRWVDLGEGQWGDFNPEDPADVPLLRFDVSVWNAVTGKYNSRESRCTGFSADASKEVIAAALDVLLERFYDAYIKNPNGSLKALADELSSISDWNYNSKSLNGGAQV